MQNELNLPTGHCAVCGKEIPIPSVRDHKAHYCSRAHASMSRFQRRYRGSSSGPADRPDIFEKMNERRGE